MSNLTPDTGSFRRRLTRMVACGLLATSILATPLRATHASVPADVSVESSAVNAAAAVPYVVVWLVGSAIANWIMKRYYESRGYTCIPYAPAIMCYRHAS